MIRGPITLAATAAAAPTAYLLGLLAAAAVGARRKPPPVAATPPRIAVVVPAHDEEAGIAVAVESLRAAGSDTTIVIADNCTDATADRARRAGATVWERDDPANPGKGRALAWAFERIARELSATEAVAVVDADCAASPNLLTALGDRLASGGGARAVQASYGVSNPGASPASAARFAGFALINHVRPLGKSTLGLSCGLLGSGMAFSMDLLRDHPWNAFAVTEDAEYHLRIVEAGERVEFAPEAAVLSAMPTSLEEAATQRERWEAGGFDLAKGTAWRLIVSGDPVRINAGVELLIPPQSLLLAANFATGLAATAVGARAARRAAAFGLAGQAAYVLGGLALVRAPASVYRSLALAPVLAARNASLFARLARGWRPGGWVRTKR